MKRFLVWAGAGVAIAGLLGATSVLLALASVGVFGTSGGAWTTDVRFAGIRLELNVIGLMRLGTLPGVAPLFDGRSFATRLGTLRVAAHGRGLRVACAPCRVEHPDFAAAPVQFNSAMLDIERDGDALEGVLLVDRVRVPFTGRLHAASVELAWTLSPTDLALVYAAVADGVPEAAYARIEGRVQGEGTLALPSRRTTVHWAADALDVGGLGTEQLQYGAFHFACAQADGTPRLALTGDGEKAWSRADAMGPYLAAAVLAAEDQRFHQHAGYDERAVAAILADLEDGRPKRGGSTITQQLARTLFTGGERTALRKLRELLYAVEMERTLGKSRILELYLNTVDWGPGVCGAKAAARAYFNKPPARLAAIEAAWLASVLRNPHDAWTHQFVARDPDRERATRVLMQMRDWPPRERRRFATQTLAFAPTSKGMEMRSRVPSAFLESARR